MSHAALAHSHSFAEPLEAVHALVRTVVAPWDEDRFMAPDIEAAVELIRANRLWTAVEPWLTARADA